MRANLRNPLAPSLTLRRTLFAGLVTFLSMAAFGGAIGFGAANDGAAAAGETPESLTLPVPNKGDRGIYTVTLVEPHGSDVVVVEEERVYASFEWIGEQTMRDAAGDLRRAHIMAYSWEATCGDEPCRPSFHVAYDAVTGEYLASFRPMTVQGGEAPRSGWSGSPATVDYAQAEGWQPLRLCGIANGFQGRTVPLNDDVVAFQECEVKDFWVEGLWYRAVGTEMVGGYEAVSFTQVGRGFNGAGGGGDSHFWASPEVPYVLRIAVQLQEDGQEHRYLVFRLTEFVRGETPMSREPLPPDPLPAVQRAPRQPWGPDDAGVEHPFSLSAAYARAQSDAELQQFLEANPDAYAGYARYDEEIDGDTTRRLWAIHVTNGKEGVTVCPQQTVRPAQVGPLKLPDASKTIEYSDRGCEVGGGSFPTPDVVPAEVPSVRWLLSRWVAYAPAELEGRQPNGWDYTVRCNHGGCDAAVVLSGPVLRERALDREEGPITLIPGEESSRYTDYAIVFDGEGRAQDSSLMKVESGPQASAPQSGGPLPPHDPIRASSLQIEPWVFPTGKYAAATGGAAIFVGLAYWLWPSLKLGLLGLFSRVEKDGALHQATRAHLHQLVEANPGIHFQELVRQSGKGRGTVEHHVRKLVQVGLVAEQPSAGYVCFFPKGTIDRRLMAAAPILKSEGARAILRSVAARPGATGIELAAATGLDAGTVSYHLKRLADGTLVTLERVGREVRAQATDTGRAAVAN